MAATASTPRAEICGSGDRLRERTALGTKNPPPPPDAMAGSVCLHYAAVEVCDRGTAGGESLAGERRARNKTVGQETSRE